MDFTMEFKVEHQITEPELDLAVMEACYEEPENEELYTTEEVQMRSQAQKQGQNQQGNQSSILLKYWFVFIFYWNPLLRCFM